MKSVFSAIAGLVFATFLLLFLLQYSGLDIPVLGILLQRPTGWELLAIFLTSLAHMALGALKWRAIVTRVAPVQTARTGHMFFLFYTSLSAALAQFVMVHVASLLVRGIAGRIHHNVPFIHGAAASLFEQVFDVYILLMFASAGIIVWSTSLGIGGAVIVTIASIVLGWLLLLSVLHALTTRLRATSFKFRFMQKIVSWFSICDNLGLIEQKLIRKLFVFSVLRYISMLVRMVIVVMATMPAIALFDAVIGFAIVQTAQIVAFTPGSLGITEWTWTGFLALLGYPAHTATAFSLALRILSYASILAVLGLAGILFALERSRHHQHP